MTFHGNVVLINIELIAGGDFRTAGGVSARGIARWDGSAWHPLEGGVNGSIFALTVHNTSLAVGGQFTTAGDVVSAYWARWRCAAPSPCAGDGNCNGFIDWRDIDYLVAAQNDNESGWAALFPDMNPPCSLLILDTNGDGHVNWRDIDPFLALMNTTCP